MDSMRVQSQRLLLNWKTNDRTVYLKELMHADENIQYVNYQNQTQLSEYLMAQGHESVISDII